MGFTTARKQTAALCTVVVAVVCVILLCVSYHRKQEEMSADFLPVLKPIANLFDEEMIGKLNYDVWRAIVGYHVDDMRIKRDFPNNPEERKSIDCLEVTFDEDFPTSLYESDAVGKYAHKIYGYIGPPHTGIYVFSIEMRQVTAACTAELWLSSDSRPERLRKILVLEHPEADRSNSPTGMKVESEDIELSAGHLYYLEFLEKAFDGRCKVEIKWRTPVQSLQHFVSIPNGSLAMAVKLDALNRYTKWPVVSALQSFLPSNELQSHHHVKNIADKFYPITKVDYLPKCTVNMMVLDALKRSWGARGSYKIPGSNVYPPDDTWHMDSTKKASKGNEIIDPKLVQKVLSLYAQAFEEKEKSTAWRWECWFKKCSSDIELRYMEETVNSVDGSRFLLELNIRNGADVTYTSEYVYLPTNKDRLCHIRNFQWADDVDVHFVITVKNLGYWVKHFIHNMEYIYAHTHDEHFEVVIVDFESEDIDVEQELRKSSLKRWKVIKLLGDFAKTKAHNEAILKYVKDPNSIVMTLDLHLTIPLGFIQYVRKHVIKGKMAFAPVFFKLNQGYTEINLDGHWGIWTYGLFAMYRSDWETFGGFNTQQYSTTWGGEDWDVADRAATKGYEVFRIRYPGVVHYYHTRAGMWQWADDKLTETAREQDQKPVAADGIIKAESKSRGWNYVRLEQGPLSSQEKTPRIALPGLHHRNPFSSKRRI